MSEEPKLVCATCGCERPKRFFRIRRTPALCRSCHNQRPEVKERMKEYNQRPEVKERKYAAANANIQKAADTYIKFLVYRESKGMLRASDIPQNIIELKRHALILKRAITEQQDEQHTATDI